MFTAEQIAAVEKELDVYLKKADEIAQRDNLSYVLGCIDPTPRDERIANEKKIGQLVTVYNYMVAANGEKRMGAWNIK